jgi:DNA-directed RNA polymerase subunit RPC12/RpoP
MSSEYIIVCKTCASYRTKRVAAVQPRTTRYHCECCGDEFDVNDPAAHVKQYPPKMNRCMKCDEESVELLERNHRYDRQPTREVVDLYRCSRCGQEIHVIVQEDPGVLYD